MSIDVDDVQGNVLRGLGRRYCSARHFFLGVRDPAGARGFLRGFADGDGGEVPGVPSSADWKDGDGPESCLNVGITWLGLQALGVPAGVLAKFPPAFREGPAARARVDSGRAGDVGLGDVGESAPEGWVVGGPRTPPIHLVVSLYARGTPILDTATAALRAEFATSRLSEHATHDAHLLGERDYVHFGYRDGIAQPRIAGAPRKHDRPDGQPEMPAGDLLLGRDYENSFGGNYAGDLPGALADNATYGAFRILAQDVAEFEDVLSRWADEAGMDRELVAAKLMGRWRNGVPLVLSPDTPRPKPELPDRQLNDFDYVSPDGDPHGLRCPIGAHVRRLNPRSAPVMGKPYSRRIVRRNMSYGPEYDARNPDRAERGLIGYFLCGDLEVQWEFMQRVWVNADFATSGLGGTREPVGGAQPVGGGTFTVPRAAPDGRAQLGGLRNLVRTRGSLYCLLPGRGGLRYLASLGPSGGAA